MRTTVAALLFLLFLWACAPVNTNDEEALKAVVMQYYDGIHDHDRRKMTDVVTDDFILYEQGKIWNNDSVFHEMDKYPYKVNFSFDNIRSATDRSTGHLTYQVTADFVFDDTVRQRYNFLESAGFVKHNDEWKMKFLHVTLANATRYDTIHYAPEYYAQRLAAFSKEPMKKAGVVFIGNSIVEYADWGKLLNDPSVINRGVAADNTFGVLRRLKDVISRQPGKLFIEIGINDIAQNIPNEIIIDNIHTIMKRVKEVSPATNIYFISILPTNDNVRNEYPDVFGKNEVTDMVNARLREKSGEWPFTFIDVNSTLRDDNNKLDVKYAEPDGLHLNEEGYKTFVKTLDRYLK